MLDVMSSTRYFCQALNKTSVCSTDFRKHLKHQISWKSIGWEPNLFHADRQTDGRTDSYDEAESRFSHFYERAYRCTKGQHFIYALKWSVTVPQPTFTKIILPTQTSVSKCYTEFHDNSTNSSADDCRWQTDTWMWYPHKTVFLYFGKNA
jgi:hypothetical protein